MQTDTLIIGCGIAGAAAALRLSQNPNHHITILTRAPEALDSNTALAQGGIVTRGLDDDPELLVNDILQAGAGLSSRRAARILATEGAALVQSVLIEQCGVNFDRDESGDLSYGLEAAHSRRRVVHVGDKTGWWIANHLLHKLATRPNITLLTGHTAVDLILTDSGECAGAVVLERSSGNLLNIGANATILATGGIGQVYANTTNPSGARGDGVAMAWRAGAKISNAEYVQFHPTALYTNTHPFPLVSEAVRGEGAILLTPDGHPFMADYDPIWKDLAPRDVVARAIYAEMQRNGYEYVYLDLASQHSAEFIQQRFPQLVENCQKIGLDPAQDWIPVVPAAHYFCGGVAVDEWGSTTIHNLYAVGEVSCTGLHGANRLASTSLLEGLVWGDRAGRHIQQQPSRNMREAFGSGLSATDSMNAVPTDDRAVGTRFIASAAPTSVIDQKMKQLQRIMWEQVGLVRTELSLRAAGQQLHQLSLVVDALYETHPLTDDLIGLRNAVQAAQLIAWAAQRNRNSIGAHYRADQPAQKIQPKLMEPAV